MVWPSRAFAAFLWMGLGFSLAAAADRPANIQRAIDRGVAFLRANQSDKDGMWHFALQEQDIGATALAGLTLLECDVPPNDPAVTKAAEIVREKCVTCTYTYSLSTSIMFLDKLDEEADVPLIQSMAIRLLAGQTAAGGWTYNCPSAGGEEMRRLTDLVKNRRELKSGKEMPKKKKLDDGPPRQLPKEVQDQLRNLVPPKPVDPQQMGVARIPSEALLAISRAEGDNSNTQFASLALWVARRSGMPVEEALLRVENRFRKAQHTDGGWTYINTNQSLPSEWSLPAAMTCSGLIGLAVGQGIAKDNKKDLNKDPNIRAAFTNLSNHLQVMNNVSALGGRQEKGFYFLWSLERVAEVYGLKMIGKTDWYRWASSVLLKSQQADGGFYGEYAQGGVDTCFALLMLSRANVAKDLSRHLSGRLKDGIVTLRSGGVGRESLQNIGKKSADAKAGADKPDPSEKTGSQTIPTEKEDVETQAARMSDELAHAVQAGTPQQSELLEKYQDGKGTVYTLALAGAIPRLNGEAKTKAREALANRFTRMTAATLRQELKDDDPEIRRAAALACAMKDDKAHIPDLIPMLQDFEPIVGRGAHAALKSLSGKDFGPPNGASAQDVSHAVAAWKGWWDKYQADKEQGK
jgi:hypothetical protein